MRILVTGGAGFIGSHIVDEYIREGHAVAVLDNLSTGFRRNLNPRAKFHKADIRDASAVRKIIGREQPQIISHHAAIAEVIRSMREPAKTLEVNVLGTANLLTAFEESRARNKKFIFASTGGAIYGEPKKLPAAETEPAVPLSVYGLSKKMDEELVRYYARQDGFEYLIFRYANVYGPRQNPKGEAGVVAIFGGLLKNGKQPVIFGDGTKTRDYVYVGDVVRANLLALRRGRNTELNLGLGRKISDYKVFEETAVFYKYSRKPRFARFRPGEVQDITLDARRARQLLGWMPEMDFETGVFETLNSL